MSHRQPSADASRTGLGPLFDLWLAWSHDHLRRRLDAASAPRQYCDPPTGKHIGPIKRGKCTKCKADITPIRVTK